MCTQPHLGYGLQLGNHCRKISFEFFGKHWINLPRSTPDDMILLVGGNLKDLSKKKRIRYFLTLAILITIPCYCLGFLVLRINQTRTPEVAPTRTPTVTRTPTITQTPYITLTPSETATVTETPTSTVTRTLTVTPTETVIPTLTLTPTIVQPTETRTPTATEESP